MRSFSGAVVVLLACLFVSIPAFSLDSFSLLVQEMISAFSQGTQGANDPAFKEKVDEIDKELQQKLERDHDLAPFFSLIETAEQFSARRNAKALFEPIMQRAVKRITFSQAQRDLPGPEFIEKLNGVKVRIEKYLDPTKPDEDTVDRKKLEKKKQDLQKKIAGVFASLKKVPEKDVFSVEVIGEDGQPGKLQPSLKDNLVGKIKSLVPSAKSVNLKLFLRKNSQLDVKAKVLGYTAANGMAVTEAELDFEGISYEALKNSSPTEYTNVLDNSTFARYRSVYDEEQLNASPFFGTVAFELGTVAPGKTWKIPFAKSDAISSVVKALEGDSRFEILNAPKAVREKAIEIKNMGDKDFVFLQGTDKAGICSVKALGFFGAKDGYPKFEDVLLLVDDQISSDLGKFVGMQAVNFTLRKAHDEMKKQYPFTVFMEKVMVENAKDGKKMFIFSGRGRKVN